jgi:hypothetical protein
MRGCHEQRDFCCDHSEAAVAEAISGHYWERVSGTLRRELLDRILINEYCHAV